MPSFDVVQMCYYYYYYYYYYRYYARRRNYIIIVLHVSGCIPTPGTGTAIIIITVYVLMYTFDTTYTFLPQHCTWYTPSSLRHIRTEVKS